ncbi:MAG: hypothetical protein O3A85_00265 [Proteobacteria bacterium]|nr:hypothetical protein [Pseudomonadota bacterium]
MKLLAFLGKHATKFIAASIFLALAVPGLASEMRPLLAPAVWGLLFLALLRTDWDSIGGHVRRLHVTAVSVAWLLVLSPVVLWAFFKVLGVMGPGIASALILMAAAPPLMSTPALAMIIGLDGAFALVVMIASTFLSPFILPVLTLGLLGLDLEISSLTLSLRLLGLITSALLAAFIVRKVLTPARLATATASVDGLVVLMMLVFAVAIMDGVTARLIDAPGHFFKILVIAFAAYALFQLITSKIFAWMGRFQALTLGFVSGNRNMGLLLAVLPAGLHPDIVLYIALAQFPIYLFPLVWKPLYGRLQPPTE